MDCLYPKRGNISNYGDYTWNKIMSKRGLRQGDLLSPLPFVLEADTFTQIIGLAGRNGY